MRSSRVLALATLLVGRQLCTGATEEIVIRSGPQRASLLELYTSEGCSSCPPAEEWFSGLRKDPRLWKSIVPIAFHVDYWDRLGWKDRFAQPEFTARQRSIATASAASTVYTPGFLVDGREWQGWFEDKKIPLSGDRVGTIEARIASNGEIALIFSPEKKFEEGTAHFTQLGFDLASDVRRGENSGRKLHHDFVVLSHASATLALGSDNRWTARFEPSKANDTSGAIVVWVESAGRPVQAAGGWLGH